MIDTSTIPKSDYIEKVHYQDGDTQDIIKVIIKADKQNDKRFCKFAEQFKGEGGLKKLWEFAKYQIAYKTDDFGEQNIKLPAALWLARYGDCKSKTLFINQILKCLGIDYITRFTGYTNGDYTHVYSIAVIGNKKVIIDSVFDYFNKEAAYTQKKDYTTMTKISTITGYQSKKIGIDDLTEAAMADGQKRFAEIQQKKRYVEAPENLNFGMMSEGEALLHLLIRKMDILGVMQENKTLAEQGKNIIRNTMRTGKITGVIPDQLQGMAARMDVYLKMNGPATGHGVRGRLLKFLQVKANLSACNKVEGIGAWTNPRRCLLKDFYKPNPQAGGQFQVPQGTGTTSDPFGYQIHQDNFCYQNDSICNQNYLNSMKSWGDMNRNTLPPNFPVGSLPYYQSQYDLNQAYYYYGRTKAEYRLRFNTGVDTNLYTIMQSLITQYPSLISEVGWRCYQFNTEAAYNLAQEELKQKLGVLSNWANDLFRADNTRPDGTVGSGMLYTFVPDVTNLSSISAINPANFPTPVQVKMGFQDQFLGSCIDFSAMSPAILKDLSENGILFDSGGESPEKLLAAQLYNFNPNISIAPAVIAALIALAIAIVNAIPAVVAACNKGAQDARLIDQSASDTAQFKNQSTSTLPSGLDFLQPGGTGSGGGGSGSGGSGGSGGGGNNNNNNTGGSGSGLIWAAAAAGGLWLYNKKKKN